VSTHILLIAVWGCSKSDWANLLDVFENDEEAIAKANDSSYGLNACIHTKDMARGMLMAKELEYGQVHMNSITVYVSTMAPQGGVKGSGWGRMNAGWGVEGESTGELFTLTGGADENARVHPREVRHVAWRALRCQEWATMEVEIGRRKLREGEAS
jgi:hypothetical protein